MSRPRLQACKAGSTDFSLHSRKRFVDVRSCHSGLATERHCRGTGITKKTWHCLRSQHPLQMRTIDHQCFQVKHLLLRIPGRCRLTASLGEARLGLGRCLLLRPFAGSCWERCLRWLHSLRCRRLAAGRLSGWRPCPVAVGVEQGSWGGGLRRIRSCSRRRLGL